MYKKITPSELTLKYMIDYSVKNFADSPSVSFVDGSPISYKELGTQIDLLAAKLFSYGLKKGDKVALFSQNMPNWVVAYFAVVSKGLVIVPILPDFTRAELENVMAHSEAKILILSDKLISRTEGLVLPDLLVKISVESLLPVGVEPANTFEVPDFKTIEVKEEDIAAIIYTSGTTGRSKGVVLSHRNICFVAMQSYPFQPINNEDIFLSFLPLSHRYEKSIGLL